MTLNAGKYNKRITIYQTTRVTDAQGFQTVNKTVILKPYAAVKTTKGFTLIANNSDFEKAYTNFTIRFPKVAITRDMLVEFSGAIYTIEYLNNINLEGHELEIQAKEVRQ